ncbi:MAG TPA: TonB family protein [Terriglobales bacterium]
MSHEPDLGQVATSLAAQGIESSELALDLILHDIAEQARQSAGASGAAIALEREGEIVCRAAAGSTAPDLGIRISSESGLTAACLRERKPQVCSDTETDRRVDAEACRQLGVRSIVVVPLFSRQGLVGVFEIFSPHANAFTEQNLKRLEELGTWVTKAMSSAGEKPAARPGPVLVAVNIHHAQDAVAEPTLHAEPAPAPADEGNLDPQTRMLRLVVLALAILLCILLGYRWGWQRKQVNPPAASTPPQPISQPVQQAEVTPQNLQPPANSVPASARKPPAVASSKTQQSEGSLVVFQDGKQIYRQGPDSPDSNKAGASNNDSETQQAAKPSSQASTTPPPAKGGDQKESASNDIAPPPLFSNPSSAPPPITATPVLPSIRVSGGVTGGRLLHKVAPQYPVQARQQGVHGIVVLQAIVDKDGRVKDVKVTSGDRLLTAAAIASVRQWRYEPFMLSGQPTEMTTEIKINFSLP